jgi:hypothetical protein
MRHQRVIDELPPSGRVPRTRACLQRRRLCCRTRDAVVCGSTGDLARCVRVAAPLARRPLARTSSAPSLARQWRRRARRRSAGWRCPQPGAGGRRPRTTARWPLRRWAWATRGWRGEGPLGDGKGGRQEEAGGSAGSGGWGLRTRRRRALCPNLRRPAARPAQLPHAAQHGGMAGGHRGQPRAAGAGEQSRGSRHTPTHKPWQPAYPHTQAPHAGCCAEPARAWRPRPRRRTAPFQPTARPRSPSPSHHALLSPTPSLPRCSATCAHWRCWVPWPLASQPRAPTPRPWPPLPRPPRCRATEGPATCSTAQRWSSVALACKGPLNAVFLSFSFSFTKVVAVLASRSGQREWGSGAAKQGGAVQWGGPVVEPSWEVAAGGNGSADLATAQRRGRDVID